MTQQQHPNCAFCGQPNVTQTFKWPQTFTAYQHLSNTNNKTCPSCLEKFTEPKGKYRRNSWYIKNNEIIIS